jgi:FAD/FMN-containing dehydrogenase
MSDLLHAVPVELDRDPQTLHAYSHDASIFEVMPEGVIYPRDVAELQSLVRYVNWQRQEGDTISLTPRNGGTCMSGGSLTESYSVDMSRYFTGMDTVDFEAKTLWVQGGVMHREVERVTHSHKLLFPPYTSSHDICGVGGMIGNNASGEKSVKYGPTSANVKELWVVLYNGDHVKFGPLTPDELEWKKSLYTLEGHIYREITALLEEHAQAIERHHPKVKKNTAGYALWELWNNDKSEFNLARLFIGAQGTLGFVTDARLKLVPMASYSRMIVVPIDNLSALTPVVQTMLRFDPDTCETFDENTYNLAKIHHPEEAARASIADAQHMVVFSIYCGDSQEEADRKAGDAKQAIEGLSYRVEWVEEQVVIDSFLLIRRKSFKLLMEHPEPNTRALPFLEDTIVPLEHYGEFLASLEVILADYNLTYTYAGHIGDGSIRLIPLGNVEAPGAKERIIELSERVYDLVFAFGGSMSVDHNDGLIRTPFIERMYGKELYDLFAEVKKLLDPNGVFNPGKKVGGSLQYTADHIFTKNT